MLFRKTYLTLVGLMYVGLSLWCSLSPEVTSGKVGFELLGGAGKSEFLTIYGGLEMGMALIFLLPLVRSEFLTGSLTSCVLIHACLVLYRTIGFFLFTDISSMTYRLAAGEWIILTVGIMCCFAAKIPKSKSAEGL